MGLLTAPQTIFHPLEVGGYRVLLKMGLTLADHWKDSRHKCKEWMAEPLPKASVTPPLFQCLLFISVHSNAYKQVLKISGFTKSQNRR